MRLVSGTTGCCMWIETFRSPKVSARFAYKRHSTQANEWNEFQTHPAHHGRWEPKTHRPFLFLFGFNLSLFEELGHGVVLAFLGPLGGRHTGIVLGRLVCAGCNQLPDNLEASHAGRVM